VIGAAAIGDTIARRTSARGAPAVAGAPAPPDHRALREAAYDRLADALAGALDERLLSDLGVA